MQNHTQALENRLANLESIVEDLKTKLEDPSFIKRSFASLGGKVRSEAKTKSSRENGKKRRGRKKEFDPSLNDVKVLENAEFETTKEKPIEGIKLDTSLAESTKGSFKVLFCKNIVTSDKKRGINISRSFYTTENIVPGSEFILDCDSDYIFKVVRVSNSNIKTNEDPYQILGVNEVVSPEEFDDRQNGLIKNGWTVQHLKM